MTRQTFLTFPIALLLIVGLSGCINATQHLEEPAFTVVKKEDNFEIRQYESTIVAEVITSGDREKTANAGFKILADYIFGNNVKSESMEMTAPVTQQENIMIAMTMPVTQENTNNEEWKVRFVMPRKYDLKTLPKAKNDKITFIKTDPFKAAVIRFSGSFSDDNYYKHQQLLEEYMSKNNLTPTGNAIHAYYNPPWTLWFLKRNEVMYKLAN